VPHLLFRFSIHFHSVLVRRHLFADSVAGTILYSPFLPVAFDLRHAFMGKYDAASVAAERLNFVDMRIVWVIFVVCVGSGSGACFHYQSLSHTLISSSWGIS